MMGVDLVVTLLATELVRFAKRLNVKFGIKILGFEIGVGPAETTETIDARLQKIEVARTSLVEALSAMDELKTMAEKNKSDLADLIAAINRAEHQKVSLDEEVHTLRALAALDSEGVRKGLKLPTAVDLWRERIYGFIFGLIAAVLGSFIWELAVRPAIERLNPPSHQVDQGAPSVKEPDAKK
jgi:hypothetical protein